MSAIASGLVGAVVAAGLIALSERVQGPAAQRPDGWRTLRPGWLIRLCVIGCVGLFGAISYLLLQDFPDEPMQRVAGVLLLAGAAWGGIYVATTSLLKRISWKGNQLRVSSILGEEAPRRFSDVDDVTIDTIGGGYRVKFRDGSRLFFSVHMHGAKELAAKFPKNAFASR